MMRVRMGACAARSSTSLNTLKVSRFHGVTAASVVQVAWEGLMQYLFCKPLAETPTTTASRAPLLYFRFYSLCLIVTSASGDDAGPRGSDRTEASLDERRVHLPQRKK